MSSENSINHAAVDGLQGAFGANPDAAKKKALDIQNSLELDNSGSTVEPGNSEDASTISLDLEGNFLPIDKESLSGVPNLIAATETAADNLRNSIENDDANPDNSASPANSVSPDNSANPANSVSPDNQPITVDDETENLDSRELTQEELKQKIEAFLTEKESSIKDTIKTAVAGGLDEEGKKALTKSLIEIYTDQFKRGMAAAGFILPTPTTAKTIEPIEPVPTGINIPAKEAKGFFQKIDYLFWGSESREEYLKRVNDTLPGQNLGDALRNRENGMPLSSDNLEKLLQNGYLYENDLTQNEKAILERDGKSLGETLDKDRWHQLEDQRVKRARQGSTLHKLRFMAGKVLFDSWSPWKTKHNEAGKHRGFEKKFDGFKNWGIYALTTGLRFGLNFTPWVLAKWGVSAAAIVASLTEAGLKVNDSIVSKEREKHGDNLDQVISGIEAKYPKLGRRAARMAVGLQSSRFSEKILEITKHSEYKATRLGLISGSMASVAENLAEPLVNHIFESMTGGSDIAASTVVERTATAVDGGRGTVIPGIDNGVGRGAMVPGIGVDGNVSAVSGESLAEKFIPDGQNFVDPTIAEPVNHLNPAAKIIEQAHSFTERNQALLDAALQKQQILERADQIRQAAETAKGASENPSIYHQLLDIAKETFRNGHGHGLNLDNVHSWGEVTKSLHDHLQNMGVDNRWNGEYPQELGKNWFESHYVDVHHADGAITHSEVGYDINWLYADMHTDVGQVLKIPMHEFSLSRVYAELAQYPDMKVRFLEILKHASETHDAHAYTMDVNKDFAEFIKDLNAKVN